MVNKLNIISGYRSGRSFLKDTYFTRPFHVMNVGEDKSDPALYLMVMSSSPGILDGDEYDIQICLEEKSRLMLQSQAYQRLFNMKKGALQKQVIHLKAGSVFSYVQHPVVPHENSIFKSHSIIRLEDDCALSFGEIITCGRKHSGEIFRFKHYQNLIEIFHHQKLLVKDNVLLQPQRMQMNTTGQLEGFTHQASFFYVHTGQVDMNDALSHLQNIPEMEKGITCGISLSSPQCITARFLGNGAEQLFNCLKRMQEYLWPRKQKQSNSTLISQPVNDTHFFINAEVTEVIV